MAASSTVYVVVGGVGPGVAGTKQTRESISPVALAKHNIEVEAEATLSKSEPRPVLLCIGADLDQRGVEVSSVSSAKLKRLQREPKCSAGLIRLNGHLGL